MSPHQDHTREEDLAASSRRGAAVAPGSTPVTVVKGPPGHPWALRFLAGLFTAVLTALLTTLLLGFSAPVISAWVTLAHPTCDDPRGLKEIEVTDIKVQGKSLANSRWANVMDHHTGTIWTPSRLPPDERAPGVSKKTDIPILRPENSKIEFEFDLNKPPRDVRLVCVVNGLANSYHNYVNWGRVRTVEGWTNANGNDVRTSILQSRDSGSFQSYQRVGIPPGDTNKVSLRLVDAYVGQQITSVDPDVCGTRNEVGEGTQNDPVGCNLNPTPKAGLAEVALYEKDWTFWEAVKGRYS